MPAEIKFTNFGIPYLVEFANISIRSKKAEKAAKAAKAKTKEKENKPKLPPPPVRCPTCGHVPHHPPRASVDEHGVKAAKAPKPGGLYIRFESNPGTATEKISARRLVKLRSAIEEAVTNAGMLKPSPEETGNPADAQSLVAGNPLRGSDTTKKALFKGTYGQVKQALKEAGLVTVPCSENGFEHSTRLGALFVVNSNGAASDNLELTKLTLWG
ncbi:hypothetical protein DFH11DRAFT_1721913 [Phellopilus nigrolimitatus]|nr:hypothetical protein DFH11DRAFT_1721913 [Phellopilus nigrolimitatus]